MAGYSKIYCIGDDGWDGINPIYFQILVGDADRQWLEPRYFDRRIRPIGRVTVIIPAGPDHPDALIDACVAFSPKYFESCPSLIQVSEVLERKRRIDFHLDGEPIGWAQLREEARPYFKKITVYEAELNKIQGRSLWTGDGWPEFERPRLFEE